MRPHFSFVLCENSETPGNLRRWGESLVRWGPVYGNMETAKRLGRYNISPVKSVHQFIICNETICRPSELPRVAIL